MSTDEEFHERIGLIMAHSSTERLTAGFRWERRCACGFVTRRYFRSRKALEEICAHFDEAVPEIWIPPSEACRG